MKEKKDFRIPVIIKRQLKRRQTFHRISLKPQCKVYRGASIRYFNASFSDVLFFFKNISTPRLEPTNGIKQCCLPPLSFKISLNIYETLTFVRHLTLINRSLIKQKKVYIFSAYSKVQCLFTLYVHFSLK